LLESFLGSPPTDTRATAELPGVPSGGRHAAGVEDRHLGRPRTASKAEQKSDEREIKSHGEGCWRDRSSDGTIAAVEQGQKQRGSE
jgi:hypothetical protein